jgi:hypothetical protein
MRRSELVTSLTICGSAWVSGLPSVTPVIDRFEDRVGEQLRQVRGRLDCIERDCSGVVEQSSSRHIGWRALGGLIIGAVLKMVNALV